MRREESQKRFWEIFLGKPVRETYVGVVEEYSNFLGKHLPKGTRLAIKEIVNYCNEC